MRKKILFIIGKTLIYPKYDPVTNKSKQTLLKSHNLFSFPFLSLAHYVFWPIPLCSLDRYSNCCIKWLIGMPLSSMNNNTRFSFFCISYQFLYSHMLNETYVNMVSVRIIFHASTPSSYPTRVLPYPILLLPFLLYPLSSLSLQFFPFSVLDLISWPPTKNHRHPLQRPTRKTTTVAHPKAIKRT